MMVVFFQCDPDRTHTMMDDFIVVLQEESKQKCGKALPREIVWQILLRYGGLVSPTAMAVKTAPELQEFREWLYDQDYQRTSWGTTYACLCRALLSVGRPRKCTSIVSFEERRAQMAKSHRLNANPHGVVPRSRSDAWHMTRRAFLSRVVVPRNDNWFRGDSCGRVEVLRFFVLCSELGKGDSDGTYRGSRWSGYVLDRPPERGIVWSLKEPIDQWWKPLIEVLQGQPMTTHMESIEHAWDLYKRADRGEIV